MLCLCMKERSHTSVNIVNMQQLIKVTLPDTFWQSMKEKKQFKCKFCEHAYSQKHNLDKHIMGVHEGMKPFKCELCEYESTQKQTLIDTFWQSMKKRNHSSVNFVNIHSL